MIIKSLKSLLLLLFVGIFINLELHADEPQIGANTNKEQVVPQDKLDPRLPPVIPGEELTRAGKKIKVWSTGGSPSVSGEAADAPTAPASEWKLGDSNNHNNNGDLSIVVDGRDLRKRH